MVTIFPWGNCAGQDTLQLAVVVCTTVPNDNGGWSKQKKSTNHRYHGTHNWVILPPPQLFTTIYNLVLNIVMREPKAAINQDIWKGKALKRVSLCALHRTEATASLCSPQSWRHLLSLGARWELQSNIIKCLQQKSWCGCSDFDLIFKFQISIWNLFKH